MTGCLLVRKVDVPSTEGFKSVAFDEFTNELILLDCGEGFAGNLQDENNKSAANVRPDMNSADIQDGYDSKMMYCFRYFKVPTSCYIEDGEDLSQTSPVLPIFCSFPFIKNPDDILIARFSLDKTFLALQISETAIVIGTVGERNCDPWLIDIGNKSSPINGSILERQLFQALSQSERCETKFLKGGIIWSNHSEGNSQDLILVTTKSVLFFKVSKIRKQLRRTRIYSHPNDSFLYDPVTRALLCCKLSNGDDDSLMPVQTSTGTALVLRTYFLLMSKLKPGSNPLRESNIESKGFALLPTSFPKFRVELPPPDVLPIHIVGSLSSINRGMKKMHTDDVRLLTLYHESYFINLRSDSNNSFDLYLLEKNKNRVKFVSALLCGLSLEDGEVAGVQVLDDILCFFNKKGEMALHDIKHSLRDPILCLKLGFAPALSQDRTCVSISNVILSNDIFVSQLNLRQIFSRETLLQGHVGFFLRRNSINTPKEILEEKLRSVVCIDGDNYSAKQHWIDDIVDIYDASKEYCYYCDLQNQQSMIVLSSLISPIQFDSVFTEDQHNRSKALKCITQFDLLYSIFLPRANLLIKQFECKSLDITVIRTQLESLVLIARRLKWQMESRNIIVSPALHCFIVSLMWRMGYPEKCISSLRCSIFYRVNDKLNRKHPQWDMNFVVFAETIFKLCQKVKLGEISGKKFNLEESYRRTMTKYAAKILCCHSAHRLAAKKYLEMGLVEEAIDICTTLIQQVGCDRSMSPNKDGISSMDFFKASIAHASNMPLTIERIRFFNRLAYFLHQWDEKAVVSPCKANKAYSVVQSQNMENGNTGSPSHNHSLFTCSHFQNQGNLWSELSTCVKFPDHLFGGTESRDACSLRKLFGFPTMFL